MNKSYKDYPLLPTGRINFSKISGSLELPNLVEIQTDSYKWFLEKGIQEVMNEVFPIASYTETSFIDFISCELREPKYSYLTCKEHDYTYSQKLYVKLRLRNVDDGEMKEEEIYMGEIPVMTESGTFIVNGAERVIVSQIVRSPGAYISTEMDKSGKMIYNADLIPSRGTWLEFETDQKGLINVRIDRQKKMPATIILKALGLDDPKMLRKLFGKNEMLEATMEKDKDIVTPFDALVYIFNKLKPGEPITPEGVANFLIQKFFDHKRYDLGRAGRFKYRSKLGIYNRLAGRYLAEDLMVPDENGEPKVFLKKGEYLSKAVVAKLRDDEVFEKGAHLVKIKANKALIDALDRAAPKGKADPEIAQGFSGNVNMIKVYVDEKMDRVQTIVGTDLNLTVECLTFSDIIAIFSYLINIMAGFGDVDDIDNLGNRRIRCVGELIQTQFRIGLTKMVKTVQQKMSISDMKTSSIKSLMNIKPLTSTVREFFTAADNTDSKDVQDITSHCPNYIPNGVYKIVPSTSENIMLYLTEGEESTMYVYKYLFVDGQRVQAAWSKWDMLDAIYGASFVDNLLYIVINRNGHLCLEKMSFTFNTTDFIYEPYRVLLDSKRTYTIPEGLYDPIVDLTVLDLTKIFDEAYDSDKTYGCVTTEGVYRTNDEYENLLILEGDYTGEVVAIGLNYNLKIVMSTIMVKQTSDGNTQAMTEGRLQLRQMWFNHANSGYFKVTVANKDKKAYVYEHTARVLGTLKNVLGDMPFETGSFKFPIQSKNENVTISLETDAPLPISLVGAGWIGNYQRRTRLV